MPSLPTVRLILYPVLLLGFILALANGFGIFRSPDLDDQLTMAARQKNLSLPSEISEGRRLDFISASPGGILTYHFTLTEINRRDINQDDFAAAEIPHLHRLFTEDSWRHLREEGVELRYSFADSAGVPFALFSTASSEPLPLPVPETPRRR